jgi:hypothetical protein
MHILGETSTNEDSLMNEISEEDRQEIRALTLELDLVLQELIKEGEMI